MTYKILLYCRPNRVMELEEVTDDEDLYWFQSKEGYIIPHGLPVRVTSPYKSPKLNPTHLEVIEEKECPNCVTMMRMGCYRCTNGKIEVVTQKVLFDPDEYDEALRKEGQKAFRNKVTLELKQEGR